MSCTMISTGVLSPGAVRPFTSTSKCSRIASVRPAVQRIAVKASASTKPEGKDLAATAMVALPALVAPLLLDIPAALAINREYGILEGQIFALMHPGMMFFLFGSTIYAGYLGLQWRHTRELATEIKTLKSQKPAAKVGEDGQPIATPSSPLDQQISELEKERKELIGQRLNEKHNNWGSLLLGLGVLFSVSGAFNTFLRTGKLFPGPHLYAGMAITVLWALAAALVPSMQKGNETARSAHIALNTVNVLLFAWQIPTGLDIVAKVFQFTTLP